MTNIDSQRGLQRWTAIPPDYRVEYTLDTKGCPVSNRIGLSREQQLQMSQNPNGWLLIRNWTETCGQELLQAMSKQLGIPAHQLIIMSDQQRMETLEVWVRSRVPIPKKAIETPLFKSLPSPSNRKVTSTSDIIDI